MAKQLSAFEKEFAAARDRGDLKFDFNGKIYTTERKDDPPRRTKYSSTADTAKFRAERDKPRTKAGQTGTRNFSSSSSSDSAPEDGTRKALKDLSARTSPREMGKIPPRKYSAGEIQNMASREAGKEGSLANQYRKESRMKDLASTAEIMATMVGGRGAGKVVGEAFEGATIPGLMEGAAATIPGKIVRPAKEMGEKLSRRASDIYSAATNRGYAKGGKVKKMANGGMFGSGAGTAPARGKALPTYNVSRNKSRDMSRIIANLPTRDRKMDMGRDLANLPGLGSAVRGGMPAPDMRALAGLGSMAGMKKGGKVEESKKMVKKEIEFFKKKKAPKAMVKHEEKEAKGMKRGGGKVMKFAKGGSIDGCAVRGKTKLKRVKM